MPSAGARSSRNPASAAARAAAARAFSPIGLGAVVGAPGHHLTLDQHRQTIGDKLLFINGRRARGTSATRTA